MTVIELIDKVFDPAEFKSTIIDIKDHFAVGCLLIYQGKVTSGLKLVNGALKLIGCKNQQYMQRIRRFVQKEPITALKAVGPHSEVWDLIPPKK